MTSFERVKAALATSVGQFSVARFFLGTTESGNFPAGVKAISEWFPMKERALAIRIFTTGSSIGAALAVPIVSFVALIWGWRMAYVVTGLLGFIWLIAWLRYYYSYLPIFIFVGFAYLSTFLLVQLLIGKLGTIRTV